MDVFSYLKNDVRGRKDLDDYLIGSKFCKNKLDPDYVKLSKFLNKEIKNINNNNNKSKFLKSGIDENQERIFNKNVSQINEILAEKKSERLQAITDSKISKLSVWIFGISRLYKKIATARVENKYAPIQEIHRYSL